MQILAPGLKSVWIEKGKLVWFDQLSDREFVKLFPNSQIFNFTREERVNRDIFGKKMKMENILLIYFEQIVSFCTQIQT